jgi:dihydroorotate dehydrogenase (fumarate)
MDLSTQYMGLDLAHPLIASASPLSHNLDGIRRLEDSGAAAVVMFSLFEEQIQQENDAFEHQMMMGTESYAESLNYFPQATTEFHIGPERYLDLIRQATDSVDIPVIASLNGYTEAGWIDYAINMQAAGATAIELNINYIPTDRALTGAQVEQRYVHIVQAVKTSVSIPVAVKLSPFFSAFANMATELDMVGADALVLFNRFYQPDIDLIQLELRSDSALRDSSEIRLPLRWIAVLHGRIKASIAASTGVYSPDEVIKYLLVGADAVMSTSALLTHGPEYMGVLRDGLARWMTERSYDSLSQMRGSMSQANVGDASELERENYIQVLEGYSYRV